MTFKWLHFGDSQHRLQATERSISATGGTDSKNKGTVPLFLRATKGTVPS
jgi:hypothetical protein